MRNPSRVLPVALTAAFLAGVVVVAGCNSQQLDPLPATSSEVHFQGGGAPPVDILWVVDDSGSMADEQTKLANDFQTFIQYFQNLHLDYHLGITTTDDLKTATDTNSGVPGCTPGTSGCHAPGEQGKLVGVPNILTPQTQNVAADFVANVNVGTGGWRAERGLEGAKLALSEPMLSGANAGFFRPNAILAVIIVSDEEDQSIPFGTTEPTSAQADDPTWRAAHLEPVSDFVSFFLGLKNNNASMVNLSVIVGVDPNTLEPIGCQSTNSADPGVRYVDAAKALHGVIGSICADTFGPILDQIGSTVAGAATAFALNYTPVDGSVTVTVDGNLVPQCSATVTAGCWSYNTNINEIQFSADAVPGQCAVIQINYNVKDFGNGISGNNELPPAQCGAAQPVNGQRLDGGAFSCSVSSTHGIDLGAFLAGAALIAGIVIRRRSSN